MKAPRARRVNLNVLSLPNGGRVHVYLPANRVAALIGSDLAQNVTVHRLRVMDSFNEGVSTYGVISGPENMLDSIARKRSLSLKDDVPLFVFQSAFPRDALPDCGAAYTDGRSTFYFHADTDRIYFQR